MTKKKNCKYCEKASGKSKVCKECKEKAPYKASSAGSNPFVREEVLKKAKNKKLSISRK